VYSFNFTATSSYVFNTNDTCADISVGGVPTTMCHERCHLLVYLDFGNHCSGETGTFSASGFNEKDRLARFFDLLNNYPYILGYEVIFSESSLGAGGANDRVDLTNSAIQEIDMRIDQFSIEPTLFDNVPAMNLTLSLTFTVLGIPNANFVTTKEIPLADTYIYNGTFTDVNFGNATILQIDTDFSNDNETRVAYLRFNLPDYEIINKATLILYGNHNFTENVTMPILIYGVDDNGWDESLINFDNAPAVDAEAMLFYSTVGKEPMYYEYDVTPWVRLTYPTGGNQVSFAVKSFIAGVAEFYSRESAQPPQLVLLTLEPESSSRNVPAGGSSTTSSTEAGDNNNPPGSGGNNVGQSDASIIYTSFSLVFAIVAMLLL